MIEPVFAVNNKGVIQRAVPMQDYRVVWFKFEDYVDNFAVLIDIQNRVAEILKFAKLLPCDVFIIKKVVAHNGFPYLK